MNRKSGDNIRLTEAMDAMAFEISRSEHEEVIILGIQSAIERNWVDSFGPVLKQAKETKDAEVRRN